MLRPPPAHQHRSSPSLWPGLRLYRLSHWLCSPGYFASVDRFSVSASGDSAPGTPQFSYCPLPPLHCNRAPPLLIQAHAIIQILFAEQHYPLRPLASFIHWPLPLAFATAWASPGRLPPPAWAASAFWITGVSFFCYSPLRAGPPPLIYSGLVASPIHSLFTGRYLSLQSRSVRCQIAAPIRFIAAHRVRAWVGPAGPPRRRAPAAAGPGIAIYSGHSYTPGRRLPPGQVAGRFAVCRLFWLRLTAQKSLQDRPPLSLPLSPSGRACDKC